MQKTIGAISILVGGLALGCGTQQQEIAAGPQHPPSRYGSAEERSAPQEAEASDGEGWWGPRGPNGHSSAPAPAAQAEERGAYRAPRHGGSAPPPMPAPETRPGLGTEWGESRTSEVRNVPFERRDGENPFAVTTLYYNDEAGVHAMTGRGFEGWTPGVVSLGRGALTVSLVDDDGRPLSALRASGRTCVIGENGDRYVIRVDNHTPYRFEVVATVDGLDVIDGGEGSFAKRGYLVSPWATLEIEGFRKSEDEVAAFRFGSVRDSYAARRGKDRNVGVVGVALFGERNAPWSYDSWEVERRQTADPFPNRFAPPPPPRY